MMVCFKLLLFLVICTTLLENPASANTITFMSATGKWKEWTTVISISLSLDLSDWFKENVSDAEKCGPRIGIFIKTTSSLFRGEGDVNSCPDGLLHFFHVQMGNFLLWGGAIRFKNSFFNWIGPKNDSIENKIQNIYSTESKIFNEITHSKISWQTIQNSKIR